jgi:hypothetical protein
MQAARLPRYQGTSTLINTKIRLGGRHEGRSLRGTLFRIGVGGDVRTQRKRG